MKFLVDRTLGKLAKKLRMLGYDAVYYREEDAHQLIHLARQGERVILTRNTKLVPGRAGDRIIRVIEDKPSFQLRDLIQEGLISLDGKDLFTRCLLCNGLLDEIPREEAEGKVPDFILCQQKKFFRCPQCRRIYWQGTHPKNMQRAVDELRMAGRKM